MYEFLPELLLVASLFYFYVCVQCSTLHVNVTTGNIAYVTGVVPRLSTCDPATYCWNAS